MPTGAGTTTTIATTKALDVFAAPDDHLAGGQELKLARLPCYVLASVRFKSGAVARP